MGEYLPFCLFIGELLPYLHCQTKRNAFAKQNEIDIMQSYKLILKTV